MRAAYQETISTLYVGTPACAQCAGQPSSTAGAGAKYTPTTSHSCPAANGRQGSRNRTTWPGREWLHSAVVLSPTTWTTPRSHTNACRWHHVSRHFGWLLQCRSEIDRNQDRKHWYGDKTEPIIRLVTVYHFTGSYISSAFAFLEPV